MGQKNSQINIVKGEIRANYTCKNVKDGDLITIIQQLEQFKDYQKLNIMLQDNQITHQGADILGKELSKLKQLTHLTISLSGNLNIGGIGGQKLLSNLCIDSNLIYLDLSLSRTNINNQDCEIIGQKIYYFKNLKSLHFYLSGNEIAKGCINLMREIAKCQSIRMLGICMNNINFDDIDSDILVLELLEMKLLNYLYFSVQSVNIRVCRFLYNQCRKQMKKLVYIAS